MCEIPSYTTCPRGLFYQHMEPMCQHLLYTYNSLSIKHSLNDFRAWLTFKPYSIIIVGTRTIQNPCKNPFSDTSLSTLTNDFSVSFPRVCILLVIRANDPINLDVFELWWFRVSWLEIHGLE